MKTRFFRRLCTLAGIVTLSLAPLAHAENLYPVFTDLNTSGGLMFGGVDIYDNTAVMDWDQDYVFEGNQVLRATLLGATDFQGIGFGVPVSNGENGIDETDCMGPGGTCDGTGNTDVPNATPANPAIATVNAGGVIPGRLNNGNVVRGSIWMRSDSDNPATGVGSPGPDSMPQVEAIFKWEAWKEAGSPFGDFDGPGDSDYGDRIWDQDQQGAAGSFADINADGFSGGFGAPVTVTLSTTEWTQLVVEYVVDDNPANTGNTFFPWDIGFDSFTVADVEDIRLAFFAGDFRSPAKDFAGGGSWLMDNMLLEVFENQAAADAVDPKIVNPAPVAVVENADFNGDGSVDGEDFLIWQRGFGVGAQLSDGDANGSGSVDADDLTIWQNQYASLTAAATAVPEPSSILLLLAASCCLRRTSVRRR